MGQKSGGNEMSVDKSHTEPVIPEERKYDRCSFSEEGVYSQVFYEECDDCKLDG